MEKKRVRCKVCGRKNTLQEVRADGQVAIQCSNCLWLDPASIRDEEEGEGKG